MDRHNENATFNDGLSPSSGVQRSPWTRGECSSAPNSSKRLLDPSIYLTPRRNDLEHESFTTPESEKSPSRLASPRSSTRIRNAMDSFRSKLEFWGADRASLPVPVQQSESPSIAANITSMRRRQVSRQHATLRDYIGLGSSMSRNVSAVSTTSCNSEFSSSAPSSLGCSSRNPSRRSSFSSVDEEWHKPEMLRSPFSTNKAHREDLLPTWLSTDGYWKTLQAGHGSYTTNRRFWSIALLAFTIFVGSLLIGIEAGLHTTNLVSGPKDIESREGMAIGRNKIMFYRILGNDLPPRHKPGQTLTNLKFLLEHEESFENTEKWFILNRIADPKNEATLIAMLNEHRAHYFRIPFVAEEYSAIDFKLDIFPTPDFFSTVEFANMSDTAKLRALDSAYASKNLYAMNNNGGRNAAIEHGRLRSDARWILPFDGNSFFTRAAFEDLVHKFNATGSTNPYYIVPMARLLDNQQLLTDDSKKSRPIAREEPQIAFRWDAKMQFDPTMRYGRRSKLEMLWRLGHSRPHKVAKRHVMPWEKGEGWDLIMKQAPRASVGTAGWVFRLFSGEADQETSPELRAHNRLLAIQRFIDRLDERAAVDRGFDRNSLIRWRNLDEARLEAQSLNASPCDSAQLVCAMQATVDHAVKGHVEHDLAISAQASRILRDQVMTTLLDPESDSGARHFALPSAKAGLAFPDWQTDDQLTFGFPPASNMQEMERALFVLPSFMESLKLLRQDRMLSTRDLDQLNALASDWLNFILRDSASNDPLDPTYVRFGPITSARRDLAIIALAAYLNDLQTLVRVSTRTRMRIMQDLQIGEQAIIPALEIDLDVIKMLEETRTLSQLALVHLRSNLRETLSTLQRESQWIQSEM